MQNQIKLAIAEKECKYFHLITDITIKKITQFS